MTGADVNIAGKLVKAADWTIKTAGNVHKALKIRLALDMHQFTAELN